MIVDTGVIYAAMAPRDRNHAACAKLLRATRELLLPAPVLVELDYFLTELTGSHRAFDEVLRRIENGVFTILDLAADDYPRVRELCAQYGDWPLGFVDAAVVALAERERQTRIATLDRRHFSAIKPRHTAAFELLP
ncbi:MAG TPA: PIN domain-containing protein [Streptosporangiaceae bacterium]